MAGTKWGGKAAARTNKAKYGPDFYGKIGAKGGKKGRTGGFYANRELASIAGRLGGSISRRGPGKKTKRKVTIELTPQRERRMRREYQRALKELTKVHKNAEKERDLQRKDDERWALERAKKREANIAK